MIWWGPVNLFNLRIRELVEDAFSYEKAIIESYCRRSLDVWPSTLYKFLVMIGDATVGSFNIISMSPDQLQSY